MPWSPSPTRTSATAHKQWKRIVLDQAAGRCEIGGLNCTGVADEADHITPVAEGGAEYDPRNGQGACTVCHKRKTAAEAVRGRQRRRDGARRPRRQHPSQVV